MPSDVRFAEVQKLLEGHGYVLARISGSHHIFRKPGEPIVTLPVHHGKVKHVYVRQIRKALEGD
jgi:predicted RNA binding protein YcfA (HicA-like mRNA interferase family)